MLNGAVGSVSREGRRSTSAADVLGVHQRGKPDRAGLGPGVRRNAVHRSRFPGSRGELRIRGAADLITGGFAMWLHLNGHSQATLANCRNPLGTQRLSYGQTLVKVQARFETVGDPVPLPDEDAAGEPGFVFDQVTPARLEHENMRRP